MIKIENRAFPDAARVGYGGRLSHSFVAGSRNKRSFGVNLRTPEGVALLKRLVAEADVVLENFKPGTLEKLGLGYESLRAVNPDVVMLSTNALGSTGPWSRLARLRPDRALRLRRSRACGAIRTTSSGSASRRRSTPTTTARACAPTAVLAALIRRRRTGGRRVPRESRRPS